jgi:hypothetical protein
VGVRAASAGGNETEPAEDATCLMSGEVGAVEARCPGQDLFRRIAPARDDHVVLAHRVGQKTAKRGFDVVRVQFERLSRDRKSAHDLKCIL